MARGINKVILVGNLGNDPETRYTQGGMAITRISLATTSVRKDKDGKDNYTTEIVAEQMQLLGGREGGGGGGYSGGEAEYGGSMPSSSSGGGSRPTPAKKAPSFDTMDDDIPF